MFEKLINEIKGLSTIDFKDATEKIRKYIDEISEKDFKEIVKQIGTIHENIDMILQKKIIFKGFGYSFSKMF